jgi:hypothetical protein
MYTGTCSNSADGVQSGDESDVDCGGSSIFTDACDIGEMCNVDTDCGTRGLAIEGKFNQVTLTFDASVNSCCGGSCRSCSDGIQNGNETAVDCGGVLECGCGATCELEESCLVGADCTTGYCDNITSVCAYTVAELCSNGERDGSETDVRKHFTSHAFFSP